MSRAGTNALKTERGRERAVRVTQKALAYLRTAGASSPARKAELERAVRKQRRRALEDVRNLIGKRVERVNPRTGEGESVDVTRALARTWSALVGEVYDLARKASAVAGDLQAVVPLTRALMSKRALVSERLFSTWMPWLEAAGVLLYHHGRSRHCGVVGLPELYRVHLPHTRAVVEAHLRAAATGDEDRWWWAPMCLALLESERVDGDARAELAGAVVTVEGERLAWERTKTAAVNKRVCEKAAAELELKRAAAQELQRKREEARRRENQEQRERELAAELEAFARLDQEKRAAAIEAAKAKRAREEVDLDRRVRDAAVAHAVAVALDDRQCSSRARNPTTIQDPYLEGSSTSAPPAREPGNAAAAAPRKTLAPDGAEDHALEWLRRMASSVVVDAGPEAGQVPLPPSSRGRLVPVRGAP